MLVDEQDVVLEASVQVRFQAQVDDDLVVVAVDVGVDAVKALEELANSGGEVFGEGDADSRGEGGFVVDVGLHPCHEVLDVFWCGHLGGFGVA